MGEPIGLDDLRRMYLDQAEFQHELGLKVPRTREERTAFVKEMVLHVHSETDELLRAAGAWKIHRRVPVLENRAHIIQELADILKLWMIIGQEFDFSVEDLVEAYWTKSMVVRQRHSEEWVQDINRPSVVVDIDGVLADYVRGFLRWAGVLGHVPYQLAVGQMDEPYVRWERLGISYAKLEELKHLYRVSNHHRYLKVIPGAYAFLEWVKTDLNNAAVILLTARPIHEYPNLHGDTLHWLKERHLNFDQVWWARDKAEAIASRMQTVDVLFAVDDEKRYIDQYRGAGISAFHFVRNSQSPRQEYGEVNSLEAIRDAYLTHGEDTSHVHGQRSSAAREAHGGGTAESDRCSPAAPDGDA